MKQCDIQNCSNPVFSHKKCKNHQYLRTDKKPSNKGRVMQKVIDTRKHVSFLSGKPINPCTHSNVAHVVPCTSEYKKWCEDDIDNMILLTHPIGTGELSEHTLYDAGTVKERELYAIANNCDWGVIDDLYDKLIEKYERLREQEKYESIK